MPIVSHYEINRGRQDERSKTDTGTATITMIDTDGSLDPSSGSSDYDPMKPVSISLTNPVTSASSPIFTGHVARWGYDLYQTEQYGVATIDCVDGMDVLAACEMKVGEFGDAWPPASEGNVYYDMDEQVKHRIDHVLTDAGWPVGNREIFTGNVRMKSTVYAPRQPALTAIQDAADAEFPNIANVYMQKNGYATFHGREARFRPEVAQYHIAIWECGDLTQFALDSGTAVIFDLDYDRDKDRIINSALATPEGVEDADIETNRYEDAASVAEYGTRSWSAENLLTDFGWLTGNDDLNETLAFAFYHVENHKDPRTRVNRIGFQSVGPGDPHAAPLWALMCGVEISDIIRLKTTHFGGAGGFDEDYFVEGLHYDVRPLSDGYLNVHLDLDVSPRSYWTTEPA